MQDLDADTARIPHLAAQRLKINGKIDALKSGESASSLRQQVNKVQADMEQARAEYIRKSAGGNKDLENQIAKMRTNLECERAKLSKKTSEVVSAQALIDGLKIDIPKLREKVKEVHYSEFDESKGVCHTCGRPYPEEKMEEMHGNFNEQKAKQEADITRHGLEMKQTLQELTERVENGQKYIDDINAEIKATQNTLNELRASMITPPAWETTAAYANFQKQIADVKISLNGITTAADEQIQKLQAELEPIEAEMQAIRQRKANAELVEKQNQRIAELDKDDKKLGIQLAQLDNLLYMAEQFVQLKAADVQAEVNGSFSAVQWKLFDIQKNEGIKACCEAQVDGKDYGSLSKSEKVNAGLDIVNTLGKKMGLIMPVWHDDAESVSHPMPIEAQTIHLSVSDKDKTIRIEEEANEDC